jgi:hypothetical protein
MLKAKPGCCEEADFAFANLTGGYIPCDKPATRLIRAREDDYRMCDSCAHHAVKNRGMVDLGAYNEKQQADG